MLSTLMTQPLDPKQVFELTLLVVALVAGTSIALAAFLGGVWTRVATSRHEAALKHEMVARGMSADEIAQVLNAGSGSGRVGPEASGVTPLPLACEAVVDCDGEWSPVLILRTSDDGRLFVHHVGHDMTDNEWVEPARVCFPAGSPHASAGERAAFAHAGLNGELRKPPVMSEV